MMTPFKRSLTTGVLMAVCAAGAFAQAATPLADFSARPGSGLYSYASSTPSTLIDLLQSSRPKPAAMAQGQLVLPANAPADARLPAVVLVHGSGGVYPEEITYWARLLNEHSIAALVIDVFGPRGVKSTGDDQSRVPFAADTADAFAALGMLASHPRIDPGRIAVMGFSRGGATALRSAVARIANGAAPAGLRFAAHVAVYSAGCTGSLSVAPRPGVFGPAPILFVHGDADDYTYMTDCRGYAQRIGAAGTPTEFVVLPGARHKFDLDSSRLINVPLNSKAKEGCPLEFDIIDMKMRDRRSGGALSPEAAQALARDLCAGRGATMEGNRNARDTAGIAVIEFLTRTLKS